MQSRAHTDTTEDSLTSSNSSPSVRAGVGSNWGAPHAAAAVAEEAGPTAAVTATATATTVSSMTAAGVRLAGIVLPPHFPRAQVRRQLMLFAREGSRGGVILPFDLVPSNESAEDADDEADEEADDPDGGAAAADDEDLRGAFEDMQGALVELQAADETDAEEEEEEVDMHSSEEAVQQPATNDDFVEFSVAVAPAGCPAKPALTGSVWLDRLLRRRVGESPHRRPPPRRQRRHSVACPTSAALRRARRAPVSDSAVVLVPGQTDQTRLPPDVFDRLLGEAELGRHSGAAK